MNIGLTHERRTVFYICAQSVVKSPVFRSHYNAFFCHVAVIKLLEIDIHVGLYKR